MRLRKGDSSDYDRVKSVMNEWWGGRQVELLQHELFFDHFTDTVFIAEDSNGALIGFINEFYSQTDSETAYVHFIGVCPLQRGTGLGRELYKRFFEKCRSDRRVKVKSCTLKSNLASIEFHSHLGFRSREDSRGKKSVRKNTHMTLRFDGLKSYTEVR